MKKNLGIVVILGLVLLGVVFSLRQKDTKNIRQENLNVQEIIEEYSYLCSNGLEFSFSPLNNMTSILVIPKNKANFEKTTLTQVNTETGNRFESSNITFVGNGETVKLTIGQEILECKPKLNTELAPFNFGDNGEGGGVKQDVTLIVSENILGKWQSIDDAKFVREFKKDGIVSDFYEAKSVSQGTWQVFSKEKPLNVSFTLENNSTYMQIKMSGSTPDVLNYRIVKVTPEELELSYLDKGSILRFKLVK